ncbi:MAG: SDR family NAD(P)-dependent oxidoreductase [Candidatus Aminicenantes bacterium]|nr:SDR family NAD(P)-dependent oxidoreductase [Candidatus Aminicenantes bacterium]
MKDPRTTQTYSSTQTGLEVAVIGMSGRFPGAKNVEEFWENLKNGVESIGFFSNEELIENGVSPGLVTLPNYVKAKGYLEDIEYFDAFFFDYLPRDAEQMDPQVRILHECVWEAFENAGYVPDEYNGLIGLYAGSSINLEWMKMAMGGGNGSSFQNDAFLMNFREYLCPRISYKFNLRGPSININTACSTSLLAVHLACQGLLNGECNMAAAGAVTVSLPKKSGYRYFENMVFSPDGHCRTFDANAGGTIFGNGAAVVVLKTLEDAINDGDTIYAVVKGSAANNDGAQRIGFTAPGVSGQAAVIRAALYMAEVDPETISYVEAHGTATRLGDTIEIEALTQAFGTNKKKFCPIGSVKTNVGHLETASGVTGLIKTALSLKHRIIPPSLHYHAPNPEIDFENTPFYVNTELTPFRQDRCPLRAGVSSFGIGGSNVHVVLEEGPENTRRMQGRKYQLIVLSAKTSTALEQMTENLARYFNGILVNPTINDKELILADAAFTLKVGRRAFPYRRMLVCSDMKEAVDILSCRDNDKTPSSSNALHTFKAGKKERKAIFMFAGLEAQYVDMGRDIYDTETVFREEADLCFEILKPLLGYDIKEVLYPPRGQVATPGKMDHVDIAQLAVFILEYALAKQLMSWEIKPSAVIGYSFGEYTAACIAGVMSLEDILKLVVARGRLIMQTSAGAMLSVPLPVQQLKTLMDDELSIAIDNGASCIVAGSPHAVDRFEKRMQQRSLICIRLEAKYAIHSTLMEPILAKFLDVVKTIKLNEPCIPYISNVSGDWITLHESVDPTYWCRQIRQTAQFSEGLNLLAKQESCIFLEIGPGRDLSVMIGRRIDSDLNQKTVNLLRPQQKKVSDVYYLLSRLGWLWLYGITPNWENFYSGETRNRIPLPSYPFERKLYWPKINPHDPDKQASIEEQPKGKKTDIGDWFYIPSWKRSMAPAPKTGGAVEHLNWLLFVDDCNIGIRLADRLKLSGYDAIIVRPGAEFSEVGADAYTINPQMGEDYETLLKICAAKGKFPRGIVHCWNVTGAAMEDVQELGFYSLLHLAGALGNRPPAEMIELTVLTDHMQEVLGGDVLYPEKATILGVALTIPREYKNIKCRCIDIILPEPGSSHREKLVDRLFSELSATVRDEVIAYRNNYRWVKIYEPNRLEEQVGEISRLKKGGVYLITGGLGGIGLVLAKCLVETVKAKLILTDRSKLPPRETWNDSLLSNDPSNDSGVKINKLQELERLGAEIMLLCADVTHEEQMKEVIRLAEERFGKIDGVIHAAGLSGEGLIQGKTRETMEPILAPKVRGTLVLDALFKEKELDFFLLCSSLISVAPIAGQVAYCAANTFLNHFACYKAARDNTFTVSIAWDDWEEGEVFRRILSGEIPPHILVSATELTARMEQSRRFAELFELQLLGKGTETARHSRPDLRSAYFAPRSGIEKRMIKICEEFLGIDKLGIDDDFFELGGDSLIAISFAARIHKELNIKMDISVFFKNPTIRELAKWAEAGSGTSEEFSAIEPAEKKEYYALSSAQKRMFTLQRLRPESSAFNESFAVLVEGKINKEHLEQIFYRLIRRHETLRTFFRMVGEEPVQQIHEDLEFAIDYYETSDKGVEIPGGINLAIEFLMKDFIRPFDLSRPPLMRVGLKKLQENRHFLLLDMHHIITDLLSQAILLNDFIRLLAGNELEDILIHYKDYCQWQNNEFWKESLKKQETYWLKEFETDVPVLNLPTDYPRPIIQSTEGNTCSFSLEKEDTDKIKKLAARYEVTLYMILLALVNILMSKLSGNEDIAVGSVTAGRNHADLQSIVGMFINVLCMRNFPSKEKPFGEFLKEVKGRVIQSFQNQDYQFENLVEKIGIKRTPSRHPLFDVGLELRGDAWAVDEGENSTVRVSNLTMTPYFPKNKVSRVDMLIFAKDFRDHLEFDIEYCTGLFKEDTMQNFINYFKTILSSVLAEPGKKIGEIGIIPEQEMQTIMDHIREKNKEMNIEFDLNFE